jgi:hypothetical protein
MSSRIFVSYSRRDGAAFAADLGAKLLMNHLSVWQDIVALEGGRDWRSQIEEALRSKVLQGALPSIQRTFIATCVSRDRPRSCPRSRSADERAAIGRRSRSADFRFRRTRYDCSDSKGDGGGVESANVRKGFMGRDLQDWANGDMAWARLTFPGRSSSRKKQRGRTS